MWVLRSRGLDREMAIWVRVERRLRLGAMLGLSCIAFDWGAVITSRFAKALFNNRFDS